jgi:hypothetical protein
VTESELIEAGNSTFALVVELLGFYMTVTSAYLVVAFIAGLRLTRFQITIISTLYVFMASVSTYALYLWCMRAVDYMFKLQETGTSATMNPNYYVPMILTITLVGGIFTSLIFMWNVRNSKNN